MSILVHPDKNVDDMERAQKAFEAVNKAYKTLNNEEGFKRCQEIVEEAKTKTDELVSIAHCPNNTLRQDIIWSSSCEDINVDQSINLNWSWKSIVYI